MKKLTLVAISAAFVLGASSEVCAMSMQEKVEIIRAFKSGKETQGQPEFQFTALSKRFPSARLSKKNFGNPQANTNTATPFIMIMNPKQAMGAARSIDAVNSTIAAGWNELQTLMRQPRVLEQPVTSTSSPGGTTIVQVVEEEPLSTAGNTSGKSGRFRTMKCLFAPGKYGCSDAEKSSARKKALISGLVAGATAVAGGAAYGTYSEQQNINGFSNYLLKIAQKEWTEGKSFDKALSDAKQNNNSDYQATVLQYNVSPNEVATAKKLAKPKYDAWAGQQKYAYK